MNTKFVLVNCTRKDYNSGGCIRVCGCKPMPDAGKAVHVNRAKSRRAWRVLDVRPTVLRLLIAEERERARRALGR